METPTEFKPYPDWKMYVYTPARGEFNACVYYRQWVPLLGMQKLGLIEGWVDKGNTNHDVEKADQDAMWSMLTADVSLLYAMYGDKGAYIVNKIREMKPGMLGGKLVYPPSVVYDIDDNLDYVHPFNPTYAFYGIRAVGGKLLEPGQNVGVRLASGKEIVAWQDGVTKGDKGWTFDIARNLAWNKSLHEFAAKCDGFTTPSEYLRKYLHTEHNYPEGYVYPNSVVPEDWTTPEFAPREKEIRIIWQGGGSHMSDWYALKPAIQYIAKKYPHVKFVIFGVVFDWIADAIPAEQIEKHEWVEYAGYKFKRTLLDGDINLCVLRDDVFSRSKSAIKFYEGSLGAKPEATLAPNMEPYSNEITDGETGLLYDVSGTPQQAAESFAANLELLINNVELRRRLGENAKKWVLENRHYMKTAQGLYDYYLELRKKKMVDCPYDPEADKLPPKPAPKPARKKQPKKKLPRAKRKKTKK